MINKISKLMPRKVLYPGSNFEPPFPIFHSIILLFATFSMLMNINAAESTNAPGKIEYATFGGGCFWCTEAIFQRINGVKSVASGYAGGATPNPTYEQVCTEKTGHAEVIQVGFDPSVISYEKILQIFWAA